MRAAASFAALVVLAVAGTASAQNQYDTRGSQPATAPAGTQPSGTPSAGTGGSQYNTSSATSQRLDRSEQDDSGRGFELFYAHLDAGFSYQNLAAFSGGDKIGLDTKDAVGAAFGAGAGVRLLLFTFGLRGRVHTLSSFNLWQANAVVGLHIPISSLDLYGEVFGGYSAANAFGSGTIASAVRDPADRAGIAAVGGNVGAGLGLDYYFNQYLSLGGGVTGEALLLNRGKLDAPTGSSTDIQTHALFADSASLAGVGVVGSVRLGFHLGL